MVSVALTVPSRHTADLGREIERCALAATVGINGFTLAHDGNTSLTKVNAE